MNLSDWEQKDPTRSPEFGLGTRDDGGTHIHIPHIKNNTEYFLIIVKIIHRLKTVNVMFKRGF